MSSGNYDVPHLSSPFSCYESRRTSGSISGVYNRPPAALAALGSPSPGPSRRTYDSYVPSRPAPSYRDEQSTSYRPNIYRPEYPSNGLYSRSPSPDRYVTPSHSADSEVWDRQGPWQTAYSRPVGWQERKPPPPSPTASVRSRGQRDDTLATRMFEPSENWKQSHTDRPSRNDGPPFTPERYPDYPSRSVQEYSGDGLLRTASRSSIPVGGDRYRPTPLLGGNVRTEYDSYRPGHDIARDSRSSAQPTNMFRRDLPTAAGRWDHYEPAYSDQPPSRFPSRSGSPEWRPGDFLASPIPSDFGGRRYDPENRSVRNGLSRRSSRSSIASTHVSDLPPPPMKSHVSANSGSSSHHSRHPSDTLLNNQPPSLVSSPTSDPIRGANAISIAKQQRFSAPIFSAESSAAMTPLASVLDQHSDGQVTGNGRIPGLAVASFGPGKPPLPVEKSAPAAPRVAESLSVQSPPISNTSKPETDALPPSPPYVSPESNVAPPEEMRAELTPPSEIPVAFVSSRNTRSKTSAAAGTATRSASRSSPIASPSPQISVEELQTAMPWQDTSKVLLQLKPLFPPDEPPVSETPSLEGATSLPEALRAVVMARLMLDRQTRDDIVNPVLAANLASAAQSHVPPPPESAHSTPDSLIEEIMGGKQAESRLEAFEATRPSLDEFFEKRQAQVSEKIQRLSREYLSLHDKWRTHCASLSDQNRSILSAEHEGLHHSGRTTRRTQAITDAVRSDLEMEQIIASLGNDDAMDPNYLSMRNAATIPDMISVTQGQVDYVFDDTNHLVENPSEYFAPDTGIDDWTDEEKRIYIDRFAQFPKQFGIIAESLPHKTAAQCVDYYYLHKKRQIDFRKVVAQLGPKKKKRRGGGKKKGNALLADIAQHDAEVGKNLSSFVVPSRVAKGRRGPGRPPKVHSATSAGGSDKGAGHSATATPQPDSKSARLAMQFLELPHNPATPEPEGRLRRRKPAAPVTATTSTSASAPISLSTSVSTLAAAPTPPAPPPPAPAKAPEPKRPAVVVPPPVVAEAPAPTLTSVPSPTSVSAPVDALVPAPISTPAPIPSPETSPISAPRPLPGSPLKRVVPPPLPPAMAPSRSSSHTKTEEDDTTHEFDARPAKRSKRARKQVKSVAIIHEEPPSPPPDSTPATPAETPSGQPEPSSILTKATKILSEFEARRNGAAVAAAAAASTNTGSSSHKDGGSPMELDGDFPKAEKNLFVDLLLYYGLDFKAIAAEMPGRSSHELKKLYRANESKLDLASLSELRRQREVEARAGSGSYSVPTGVGSGPPMASLMDDRGQTAEGGEQQRFHGPYPNYPGAIPFKPRLQTTTERGEDPYARAGYGAAAYHLQGHYAAHHPYSVAYGYHYPLQHHHYHAHGMYPQAGTYGAMVGTPLEGQPPIDVVSRYSAEYGYSGVPPPPVQHPQGPPPPHIAGQSRATSPLERHASAMGWQW